MEIEAKELVLLLSLNKHIMICYNLIKIIILFQLWHICLRVKIATENFYENSKELYKSLEEGSYLSQEQEKWFVIGNTFVGRNDDELLLTPFHPLNLAYQLQLCKETDFESAQIL